MSIHDSDQALAWIAMVELDVAEASDVPAGVVGALTWVIALAASLAEFKLFVSQMFRGRRLLGRRMGRSVSARCLVPRGGVRSPGRGVNVER